MFQWHSSLAGSGSRKFVTLSYFFVLQNRVLHSKTHGCVRRCKGNWHIGHTMCSSALTISRNKFVVYFNSMLLPFISVSIQTLLRPVIFFVHSSLSGFYLIWNQSAGGRRILNDASTWSEIHLKVSVCICLCRTFTHTDHNRYLDLGFQEVLKFLSFIFNLKGRYICLWVITFEISSNIA